MVLKKYTVTTRTGITGTSPIRPNFQFVTFSNFELGIRTCRTNYLSFEIRKRLIFFEYQKISSNYIQCPVSLGNVYHRFFFYDVPFMQNSTGFQIIYVIGSYGDLIIIFLPSYLMDASLAVQISFNVLTLL